MKNGAAKHIKFDPGPVPAATFCKHCNASFPVAVPIVGQAPGTEFYQMTSELALHLNQKHAAEIPTDAQAQMNCVIAFSSQRVIRHFSSNDSGLLGWCDRQRYKLLRAVVKQVPDDRIEHKVAELFELASRREDGPQTPTLEEVILLVKSMRDAIEERNMYPGETLEPPAMPASPLISTV